MKPSKSTQTAPPDSTSSPTVQKPNSPPIYDPNKDPDHIWSQALIRGLKKRLQKQETDKK